MASLSNLARYLGVYEEWKRIIKRFGLNWENWNGLDSFMSIMSTDLASIEEWLEEAIRKLPQKYALALIFMALTGLRPNEACCSHLEVS